ncbi:hypothetical protein JXA12_01545 [Candidatus Woesearchaeota archaeon]|nr:hypothetical protein [Candidatus Woesearchaeota archaeon]
MEDVITVPHGCPVCKGDVKGNDQALYFCSNCNLLFAKHSLRREEP